MQEFKQDFLEDENASQDVARPAPLYIGAKLIRAFPEDECAFLQAVKGQDVANRETRPGYRVIYPDGYVSWSPKETFETAYREVTEAERELF